MHRNFKTDREEGREGSDASRSTNLSLSSHSEAPNHRFSRFASNNSQQAEVQSKRLVSVRSEQSRDSSPPDSYENKPVRPALEAPSIDALETPNGSLLDEGTLQIPGRDELLALIPWQSGSSMDGQGREADKESLYTVDLDTRNGDAVDNDDNDDNWDTLTPGHHNSAVDPSPPLSLDLDLEDISSLPSSVTASASSSRSGLPPYRSHPVPLLGEVNPTQHIDSRRTLSMGRTASEQDEDEYVFIDSDDEDDGADHATYNIHFHEQLHEGYHFEREMPNAAALVRNLAMLPIVPTQARIMLLTAANQARDLPNMPLGQYVEPTVRMSTSVGRTLVQAGAITVEVFWRQGQDFGRVIEEAWWPEVRLALEELMENWRDS